MATATKTRTAKKPAAAKKAPAKPAKAVKHQKDETHEESVSRIEQGQIMNDLIGKGVLSQAELESKTGYSEKRVQSHHDFLLKRGILKPGKGGKFELVGNLPHRRNKG